MQAYEGVVIARDGGGLNESFTVRKISYGEGVERVFPVYGPLIDSIKVVRRGKVRRAKLYYLRDRRGKSARIAERIDLKAKAKAAQSRVSAPQGLKLRLFAKAGRCAGLFAFDNEFRAPRPCPGARKHIYVVNDAPAAASAVDRDEEHG